MKAQQTLKHIPSMLIPLFESGTVYFCATRDDWQKAHQALDADAGMLDRRGCANTFKAIDGSFPATWPNLLINAAIFASVLTGLYFIWHDFIPRKNNTATSQH